MCRTSSASSASATARRPRCTRSSTGSSAGRTSPHSRWPACRRGRSVGSMATPTHAPVAIVTGASRGLGLALARALAARGWRLVIDAPCAHAPRRARSDPPAHTHAALAAHPDVAAPAGAVTDPRHREALVAAAGDRIDLLVNNASRLGPSPQPPLHAYPLAELGRVYLTNVLAPLALAQLALPRMDEGATILNISSDAAVEAYEGWGGYGSSKAALEQLTRVLAVEHPRLRIYAVDPGDMRTQMHQDAFPDEDISDRPPPEESVPGLLALIEGDRGSGRFVARDLTAVGA